MIAFCNFSSDNLKLLQNLKSLDVPNKFSYQILVLNTLGGLIYNHTATQSSLKESEIFECLFEIIGWKKEQRYKITFHLLEMID